MIQWLVGDCRQILNELPENSVQCCVTSPPYYGVRDYLGKWEGGNADCNHLNDPLCSNKSTLQGYSGEHVKLRTHGMPFSKVCGKCGARRIDNQIGLEDSVDLYVENLVCVFDRLKSVLRSDGTFWLNLGSSYVGGIKGGVAKNLLGIPWKVTLALQKAGWILRSEIIWYKVGGMPESVKDRPTKQHEQIFLFVKQSDYFFQQTTPSLRSVWPISSEALHENHAAPFPQKLVVQCLSSSTKKGDVVLDMFGGSGTVSLVAERMLRNSIYVDLNKEYKELAVRRIASERVGARRRLPSRFVGGFFSEAFNGISNRILSNANGDKEGEQPTKRIKLVRR